MVRLRSGLQPAENIIPADGIFCLLRCRARLLFKFLVVGKLRSVERLVANNNGKYICVETGVRYSLARGLEYVGEHNTPIDVEYISAASPCAHSHAVCV